MFASAALYYLKTNFRIIDIGRFFTTSAFESVN